MGIYWDTTRYRVIYKKWLTYVQMNPCFFMPRLSHGVDKRLLMGFHPLN